MLKLENTSLREVIQKNRSPDSMVGKTGQTPKLGKHTQGPENIPQNVPLFTPNLQFVIFTSLEKPWKHVIYLIFNSPN